MPFPQTLEGKPKIIFFTDFDGTITLKDSNDWLTDNIGYGQEKRVAGNQDVLMERDTFRHSFQGMMDSVSTPFPECVRLLCENIKLDPYFNDFYHWSREVGIPVIVLSSGMTPIIRALLLKLVGPEAEHIEIVSNDAIDRPPKTKDQEGGWQIKFHDDSDFGHDKSLTIRPYVKYFDEHPNENRPILLYAGDGVSDLSAARETDLLFAKEGKDLVTYCEREGFPFTVFNDWSSIKATTKDLFEGKTTLKHVADDSKVKAMQTKA